MFLFCSWQLSPMRTHVTEKHQHACHLFKLCEAKAEFRLNQMKI